MSDKDKREGWLKELKVGDKVAIECGRSRIEYKIGEIEKITPTGRIAIKGSIFDHTGREMGERDIWTTRDRLEPLTQEIYDRVRKETLIYKLSKTKWSDVSLGNLEVISELLNEWN